VSARTRNAPETRHVHHRSRPAPRRPRLRGRCGGPLAERRRHSHHPLPVHPRGSRPALWTKFWSVNPASSDVFGVCPIPKS
jgi:hypothetical protein